MLRVLRRCRAHVGSHRSVRHRLSRSIITYGQGITNVEDMDTDRSPRVSDHQDRQMLYGASAVQAALLARKRTFFQLYTFGAHEKKQIILDLARKLGIDSVEVDNRGVLNNFTGTRPHNGLVLECGQLPEVNVSCLGTRGQSWQPVLENTDVMQNEEATLEIMRPSSTKFPIYVFLDEVSDPQNVGSILRTAYFMGVTGVVLSKKNCSSITPVVSKAASGASDFMQILYAESTVSFVRRSQKNGWSCIATVSPYEKLGNKIMMPLCTLGALRAKGPVLVIFGSESKGLRTLVKRECKHVTTVPAAAGINPLVDSLNIGVSVATILTHLSLDGGSGKHAVSS